MILRTGFLCLLFCTAVRADVKVADLFQDLAVLQQGIKVPVWGTADPGEKVTVQFDDQSVTTVTGDDGRWLVRLEPLFPVAARPMTVTGKNRVVLPRIYVGEVWVCSGQSNMQWPLERTDGAQEELKSLVDPRLFLYTVKRRVAEKPAKNAGGRWVRASPETCRSFSAVAYYFGKRLRGELAVPVGLIHASWGGTPAEAWTRRHALEMREELRPIVRRWDKALLEHPARVAAWKRAVAVWKEEGSQGKRPAPPRGPEHPHRAAGLFQGMIAPLLPYAIRGVIWYQGESNAGRAEQYTTLFPTMIRDWRDAWGQGNFPFYFVQLASFRPPRQVPSESAWAELREAQRLALREPGTGMAVAIDLGDSKDIHPRNKRDVGLRLARLAEAWVYDKRVVPHGPLYRDHTIESNAITIRFTAAEGLRAAAKGPLHGFAIAGADRKFRWAKARIVEKSVVVTHPEIEKPVAVRYAWADNPLCDLENGARLPASPFRTDDWPLTTAGRR